MKLTVRNVLQIYLLMMQQNRMLMTPTASMTIMIMVSIKVAKLIVHFVYYYCNIFCVSDLKVLWDRKSTKIILAKYLKRLPKFRNSKI